jgi:hypothetical protein
MHRVHERIITDVMPSLRQLAVRSTPNQTREAKRTIWMSYIGLALEDDRQLFQGELGKRAGDEARKASQQPLKKFWSDVDKYVAALGP